MISTALILAAIVSVAPPATTDATRARYERYAADIAEAAEDTDLGLALVATAAVESTFRAEIERCRCRSWECDNGHAFGIYQLHSYWLRGYTSAQVCRSNKIATRLAARALTTFRRYTVPERWDLVFARYVGARTDDPRVTQRWRMFESLVDQAEPATAQLDHGSQIVPLAQPLEHVWPASQLTPFQYPSSRHMAWSHQIGRVSTTPDR